jgi:hypothetical protein
MKYVKIILFFLFSTFSSVAQFSYYKNGDKIGVQVNNDLLIPAEFDSIIHLKDTTIKKQFFKCYKGELCGLFKITGEVLLDFKYSDIYWFNATSNFSKENAVVGFITIELKDSSQLEHVGLANFDGKVLVQPQYDRIWQVTNCNGISFTFFNSKRKNFVFGPTYELIPFDIYNSVMVIDESYKEKLKLCSFPDNYSFIVFKGHAKINTLLSNYWSDLNEQYAYYYQTKKYLTAGNIYINDSLCKPINSSGFSEIFIPVYSGLGYGALADIIYLPLMVENYQSIESITFGGLNIYINEYSDFVLPDTGSFPRYIPRPLGDLMLTYAYPIIAKNQNGYGLIGPKGKTILAFGYDYIKPISVKNSEMPGEVFFLCKQKGNIFIYDMYGLRSTINEIQDAFYLDSDTSPNFVVRQNSIWFFTKSLMNPNSLVEVPDSSVNYNLKAVSPYPDGPSYLGSKYILMNSLNQVYGNGNLFQIPENSPAIHNKFILKNNQNKVGIIDRMGKEVLGFNFSAIYSVGGDNYNTTESTFKSDAFLVVDAGSDPQSDKLLGLYTINGEKVLNAKYKSIMGLTDSILLLEDKSGHFLYNPFTQKMSYGPINASEYYFQAVENATGKMKPLFLFKETGKEHYGLMNKNLDVVLKPQFDEIVLIDDNLIAAYISNIVHLFDYSGLQRYKGYQPGTVKDVVTGGESQFYTLQSSLKTILCKKNKGPFFEAAANSKIYFNSKDDFIRIKADSTHELIDTNGRTLFKIVADYVSTFSNEQAIFLKQHIGLLNLNGKILIPPVMKGIINREDSNQRLNIPNLRNGIMCFQSTKDSLWGLIDTNNNIVMQPKYKGIFRTDGDYIITRSGKRMGVIDYYGKVIHEPNYWINESDSNGFKEFRLGFSSEAGLMDKNYKIILTPEYLPIGIFEESCQCYPIVDSLGKLYYYEYQTEKIINKSTAFENSTYGKSFIAERQLNVEKWNFIPGLEGCDATAFYVDEKENYWLGTGSSGGVYFSKDKGQHWAERNKGIGPSHVSLLGKVNENVYMENNMQGIFVYMDSSDTWESLPDSISEPIRNSLVNQAKIRLTKNFKKFKPQFNIDSKFSPFPIENEQTYYNSLLMKYRYSDEYNKIWFDENNKRIDAPQLNGNAPHIINLDLSKGSPIKRLPHDIFGLRAGNFYNLPDSSTALLAKSGLYKIEGNRIDPMSVNGLNATDIRQLIKVSDDQFYALSGNSSIWRLKNKAWTKVFDGYLNAVEKEWKQNEPGAIINKLTIYESNVYFDYLGCINKLDSKNKISIFLGSRIEKDATDTSVIRTYFFKEIQFNKQGVYGIAEVNEMNGNVADSYSSLVKIKKNGIRIITRVSNETGSAFLYKDHLGNIWLSDLASFKMLENDSTFVNSIETTNLDNSNKIAETKDGKMCIVTGNASLASFDVKSKSWKEMQVEERFSNVKTPAIRCIAYDNEGNIFAGTGPSYQSLGCESWMNNFVPGNGIYLFAYNGTKYSLENFFDGPNPWILSLVPIKDGFVVGTSGSGVYKIKIGKRQDYSWKND